MATLEQEAKPKLRPNASRNLVRPDYHRQVRITYAEAALIAGVTIGTIYNWISSGKLKQAAKVGPFRIAREDLNSFLKNGHIS